MQKRITRTYFVLRIGDKYWTGWNYTNNIRSARRYENESDMITDVKTHSFELDGVTGGTLVEVHEELSTGQETAVSWRN